jgi:hypothetical protein
MNLKEWLYVLDGHNVRATEDMAEWGRCFDSPNRIVAHTTEEYYEVSTVFLGVRHNHFRPGPAILFETMVFTTDAYAALIPKEESIEGVQLRYASWDDAETGHATMIKRLRKQIEFAQSGGYETKQETEVARPTS